MPIQMKCFHDARWNLMQQVQPVTDGPGIDQESIVHHALDPFSWGENGNINKRRRGQRSEGKNNPSCMVRLCHKCQRRRDDQQNPGSPQPFRRNKFVGSNQKRKKCSCHEAVQSAEYICVEVDLVQREVVAECRRNANLGDADAAQPSGRAESHD